MSQDLHEHNRQPEHKHKMKRASRREDYDTTMEGWDGEPPIATGWKKL